MRKILEKWLAAGETAAHEDLAAGRAVPVVMQRSEQSTDAAPLRGGV